MTIIEKNEGTKTNCHADGTKLTFGDNELMLNLAKYQRPWPVHIDICLNKEGMMMVGTGEGLYYLAQVDIPSITYSDANQGNTDDRIREPLDMNDVILTLWAVETPVSSPVEE